MTFKCVVAGGQSERNGEAGFTDVSSLTPSIECQGVRKYVIGDVQGCFTALRQLLVACDFDNTADQVWLTGDLVNRGPDSLGVLRFVRDLGASAISVLGNHDFYLLAVAAGAVQRGPDDTLDEVLDASDVDELLDWLRFRPLMHVESGGAMVHAGLLPVWTIPQAQALAREVESELRGSDWKAFLRGLWGGKPIAWRDDLAGADRLRIIVNVFCRLRYLTANGQLALKPKGPPEEAEAGLVPWYAFPNAAWQTHTVFCGHWSALGFRDMGKVVALDSGAVWGGELTAFRFEDRKVFQVDCPQCSAPSGWD